MAWIKRNLYFLIGTLVAVALMGLAGWYAFSKWQQDGQMLAKLDEVYATLDGLNKQNPHPGKPPKTDNIKLAKEQQQELKELTQKCSQHFQRITPIPEGPKVTAEDFSSALSQTISQLQHDATNASVALRPSFAFSFTAQNSKVSFDKNSLVPLSVQLGEISAICDILFNAKINALDSVRRERVGLDDNQGTVTDYIPEKSLTNELAVITPYELSFRCFSPELAAVLSGFANSPYSLVVKTINVKLAPAPLQVEPTMQPIVVPTAVQVVPRAARQEGADDQRMNFLRRYGLMPGAGGGVRRPPPPPVQYVTPTTPAKTGLQTVLDERELEVTVMLNLVKLTPPK